MKVRTTEKAKTKTTKNFHLKLILYLLSFQFVPQTSHCVTPMEVCAVSAPVPLSTPPTTLVLFARIKDVNLHQNQLSLGDYLVV